MKIAFVTDSTSDVPNDLAARLGIEVVPALVNLANVHYERDELVEAEALPAEPCALHGGRDWHRRRLQRPLRHGFR